MSSAPPFPAPSDPGEAAAILNTARDHFERGLALLNKFNYSGYELLEKDIMELKQAIIQMHLRVVAPDHQPPAQ